jgi:hypothetical protein
VPVYSRADLSRTATLVVAPFLTATSANAVAREFRGAYTGSLSTEDRRIFRDAAIRSGRFIRKVE